MRKYRKKFVFQKLIYSNLMILILCILVFFVARGILKLYQKYTFTRQEYNFVETQQEKAESTLSDNQEKLRAIQTPEGEDQYLKDTYPVKKAGENMIVIYEPQDSTYQILKAKSSWQAFKDYFKKLFDF